MLVFFGGVCQLGLAILSLFVAVKTDDIAMTPGTGTMGAEIVVV